MSVFYDAKLRKKNDISQFCEKNSPPDAPEGFYNALCIKHCAFDKGVYSFSTASSQVIHM